MSQASKGRNGKNQSMSPAPKRESRGTDESKAAGLMRNSISFLYTPFCSGFILMENWGKSKSIYGKQMLCLRSLMKSSTERRWEEI